MKLYGLVLLCLFLLFIPTYSQAQTTVPTNSTSSEQYRQLLEKQFFKTGNSLFDQGNYTDAITYYKEVLAINPGDTSALNKLNLTFNNANTKEIQGIQKIDQTSLVIVGIIISLVGVIIVLNLIAKKTRKGLTQNVLETTVPVKEEEKNARPEIQDKKPEPEKIKEDEWKGI